MAARPRIKKPPKLNFEISYKNYEQLGHFLTDRAKILSRRITGLTPKEQRKLALAIKRARHLGLLPYKVRV